MGNLFCALVWALAFILHLDYEKNALRTIQLVMDGWLVFFFLYSFVTGTPASIFLICLAIGELIVLTISSVL